MRAASGRRVSSLLGIIVVSGLLWVNSNYELCRRGSISAMPLIPIRRDFGSLLSIPPNGMSEPDSQETLSHSSGGHGFIRNSPFLFSNGLRTGDRFWMGCASQGRSCSCEGTIRWGRDGAGGSWKEYPKPKTLADGAPQTIKCSVDVLPDILPGDEGKHCECAVTVGSAFYNNITNPGILPAAANALRDHSLFSSCEIVRSLAQGHHRNKWSSLLWESVEAFCNPDWSHSDAAKSEPGGAVSGSSSFTHDQLQQSMLAWTDEAFAGSTQQMYDKDGWLDFGFLTYFAGPPDGKHAKMVEMLVTSIHEFSSRPIVVVHFGTTAPLHWTPTLFPRMILLHMGPLPIAVGSHSRSFNFNKMRAMIVARIKVGVQLDADQFVAPGVDAIFDRTAEEITESYPMPIMPSHFANRSPKDLGKYWNRYCPGDENDRSRACPWQTTRWGHAHPTWTYWALPFLGRWLRRNLRDETLPRRIREQPELGDMSELRIVDVPEDEDLLNIGIWEEGGNKTWCKFDLAGPDDFNALLGAIDNNCIGSACAQGRVCCNDVMSDFRFHPIGVAKAFYTAHHAVLPETETKEYLARLRHKVEDGTLPPPIMFHERFFRNGAEVKAAYPQATCLI